MSEAPSRSERLVSGAFWNLAARIFNIALSLVAIRLLTDARGESEYGLLLLSFNLLGYFSLAGFGVPAGTVKFIAEAHASRDVRSQNEIASVGYATYLGVAGLVSVAFLYLYWDGYRFFRISEDSVETARRLFLMTGVWAVAAWPLQVYSDVLQGLQEFRRLNLAVMVQAAVSNAGYVLVYLFDWPIEAAMLAFALSQLVMFGMLARAARIAAPALEIRLRSATRERFRRMTSFSLWILAMQLSGMVISQTDQTLLALFVSDAAVTFYVIAATPMNTIRNLNMLVMGAVMPSASEAFGAQDRDYLRRLVLRGTRLNSVAMVGMLAAGSAAAYPGLLLWMGPNHAANAHIAQLLMIAYAWSAGFSIAGQTLVGMGRVRELGILSFASAIINLGFSLLLVGPLGMLGVVLGTIIAYAILAPFTVWIITRALEIPVRQFMVETLLPTYLASGGVGLVAWWLVGLLGPTPSPLMCVLAVVACGALVPTLCALLALPREDWAAMPVVRRWVAPPSSS